jgi:hypothetical protein
VPKTSACRENCGQDFTEDCSLAKLLVTRGDKASGASDL